MAQALLQHRELRHRHRTSPRRSKPTLAVAKIEMAETSFSWDRADSSILPEEVKRAMRFGEIQGLGWLPLCHTYSIVAREPATGQLGVAVQSHYFCVGGIVTWAEAGVGAVATQAIAEPAYGQRGLELMRAGIDAPAALAKLVADDPGRDIRQVAMVDSYGRVAAHTGSATIPEAGHIVGDGFSVQANMMLRSTVWAAMAEAYRSTAGDLADRLLAALDAAEAEGGDIRGRQSAALLIVPAKSSGRTGTDKVFDIRVDDAKEPLAELRRLAGVSRAFEHMRLAQGALARGDLRTMNTEFEHAMLFGAGNPEIRFWKALALMQSGRAGEGLAILQEVVASDANWRELALRLPAFMLPLGDDIRRQIMQLS